MRAWPRLLSPLAHPAAPRLAPASPATPVSACQWAMLRRSYEQLRDQLQYTSGGGSASLLHQYGFWR